MRNTMSGTRAGTDLTTNRPKRAATYHLLPWCRFLCGRPTPRFNAKELCAFVFQPEGTALMDLLCVRNPGSYSRDPVGQQDRFGFYPLKAPPVKEEDKWSLQALRENLSERSSTL